MTLAEHPEEWLPELVELRACGGNWQAYEEALYACFRADFIDTIPSYPDRRWAMKRHPEYKGKEATFWHIISEGDDEAARLPDLRRCERIKWPRCIIDACRSQRIRLWEQRRGSEKRIAIATPDFGYLVVLADRGSYVLLWTAFVVEREHQRRKLEREYRAWKKAREN